MPCMSDLPTSNELVKSLRDYSEGPSSYWLPICRKAADEIERLRRENFELQDERVRWMRIYESTITAHEPRAGRYHVTLNTGCDTCTHDYSVTDGGVDAV